MPTSTTRPSAGACTLKVAASATANTVPGIAHGTPINPSSQRRRQRPPPRARRAAASPSPSASTLAAAAIHSELTTGRQRSGSASMR